MDPIRVVVADIVSEKTTQVILIEHDDMIHDLSFAGSDPSLRRPVLPPVRGTVRG